MLRVILSLLVVVILLALAGGFILYRTVSRSGERAVAATHVDEREHLDLKRLQRGMTYEEVVSVLGTPTRAGGYFRPTWRYRNNPFSQVAVYFDAEGAGKVRWMSLGIFIYERRL